MISIIIPTLNEESVLENTLKHLKENLTIPHEIIVSDGHSKDKTIEIAKKYADKVVVFNGNYRQTIAEGRNDGANVATGEYLAYMDADCKIFNPDQFFNRSFEYFNKHPKAVALTVSIKVLPEFALLSDKIVYSLFNLYLRIMNNFFGIGIAAGEFQMIKTDVFRSVNGYNPKLVASEDVDLFYRLSKVGKIGFAHDLTIFQTGRRAHKVGWPKLLFEWGSNAVSMMFFGKALSKEWKVIR